ncbi:histidine phosphatase family protein [Sutcliffiella rhizosphaerae]|uniref:Phosphoglycerate mutase GpmB n=1 Tax=Sutcliffiella rhizosphaerae TaxID=2880967 RepID=A0ABM8YK31_9BACI|nr:histidine phosphatase family protein [Sutcliffiella rhizosphaerae]CAG9620229.1 phosphoglycerate mutase GpmB [Sutcliffiella rhizosphaerae]
MGARHCMDLYLIRHGLTDWNREKRYLGYTDRDILIGELGKLENVKKCLENVMFDAVYTSDLKRCRSTLRYLDIQKQEVVDVRLREMNFGDWEGKTYHELKENPDYCKWLDNLEKVSPPNGESWTGFTARVDAFLEDLLAEKKGSILLVTHGGVVRYLLSRYIGTNSFWEAPQPTHGQGVLVRLEEQTGVWRCSSISAVPIVEKETW